MTVTQISRVQHRSGTSNELPDALADYEIGITTDTGEIFFGSSSHPSVSGRLSYPYQNIKIITELDVQRGVTGDIYYHGALAGATCLANGFATPVISLFPHGTQSFATYDFSLEGTGLNSSIRLMGTLTICVHPTSPNLSVVNVVSDSICQMNWTSSVPSNSLGSFQLSHLDDTGSDHGNTWLAFKNSFGLDLTLSINGREWKSATV